MIDVSNIQVLEANVTSTTAVLQWDYDMNAKDVLFQVCVDCAKTNFTCQTSPTRNIKLQELRTSHSCIATIKAIINETSITGVIAPTIYTLPPDPVNFRYFATSDNFEVTYDEISDKTSPGFIEFHYYVCPAWSSCMGFNIYQPPGYGFRYMQSSTSFNFTLRTQYSSPVQRVSKLTASLTVTTLPTVPSDFTFFNITDSSVSFSWGTVSAGDEAPITYFVCHTSGMYCNSTFNSFITIKDLKFASDYTFELFAQNARNIKYKTLQ